MQPVAKEEPCTVLVEARKPEAAPPTNIDGWQLTTEILRLDQCTGCEQVHAGLSAICASLGFDAFLYGGRFHLGGARYVEHVETNYSPSWRARYERQGYIHIDPTFAHARASLSPLVWSDAMYATDLQRSFQQDARQHGLAEGVTFPVHSRNGDFARLSLSLSRSDELARGHVRAMLKWGALLATLTHEAMGSVVRNRSAAPVPTLTRRETEVLQWIADGKSNWEISRLVDISEHGVSHHVRNILLKFDVPSRHQAAAKAIAMGLLRRKVDAVAGTDRRRAKPGP